MFIEVETVKNGTVMINFDHVESISRDVCDPTKTTIVIHNPTEQYFTVKSPVYSVIKKRLAACGKVAD